MFDKDLLPEGVQVTEEDTVENYRNDKCYPKVVKAVNDELIHSNFVTPIQVFQRIQLLDKADVEKWRKGQILFLEKVIICGLSALVCPFFVT